MAALASNNERTRAVGNMSVNARGDTIDAHGKIIVPVNKKAAQAYQKTVSDRAVSRPAEPATVDQIEEFTSDDLGFDDEISMEIEQIKAQEKPTTQNKKSR